MNEGTYKHFQTIRKAWQSTNKVEHALLFAISLVVMGSLITVYSTAGKTAIRDTRATNAAKVQTLKADIAALPNLETIAPGKTSGNLDATVSARQALAKRIGGRAYDPVSGSNLYRLHPKYADNSKHLNVDTIAIRSYGTSLDTTISQLSKLKKLIEYDAVADLALPLSSSDSAERLQRTQTGLKAAKTYIEASSLPNKNLIVGELQKLINQTLTVSDTTKYDWSQQVLVLQNSVLKSIIHSDIQNTHYAQSLDQISAHYQ